MALVKFSQHCELTVGLHILNERISSSRWESDVNIEVGCSKATCFWCYTFINAMNHHSARTHLYKIIPRATHGKAVNGWLLPQTPEEVRTDFLESLGTEMQNVFDELAAQTPILYWTSSLPPKKRGIKVERCFDQLSPVFCIPILTNLLKA